MLAENRERGTYIFQPHVLQLFLSEYTTTVKSSSFCNRVLYITALIDERCPKDFIHGGIPLICIGMTPRDDVKLEYDVGEKNVNLDYKTSDTASSLQTPRPLSLHRSDGMLCLLIC